MPGEDDAGQADRVGALNHGGDQVDAFSFDKSTGGGIGHSAAHVPLVWDWEADLADRERERRVDGDNSFVVDRKVLREVVKEVMSIEVAQIRFISSGTFHKAYLVTVADGRALVARVARRFMPRLKTESEVATLSYLRQFTSIPVPQVYHYDANPYNRLGGEYILMSKASGIPLSRVYHSMDHTQLCSLLRNLAELLVPLFAHRFSHIGSLYFGKGSYDSVVNPPPPQFLLPQMEDSSSMPTPTITNTHGVEFSFASGLPTPSHTPGLSASLSTARQPVLHNFPVGVETSQGIHVGPIISWPFFGSHRGDLTSDEINRGPWSTTDAYLRACVDREVNGVKRENEGRAKPHRLHLDPDDVAGRKRAQGEGEYVWGFGYVKKSSLESYAEEPTGSETPSVDRDDSEEDVEDSDEDSDDGSASLNSDSDEDVMYRDYRRYQRSTFLVAELSRRTQRVEGEMTRWKRCMKSLEEILSAVLENAGIDAKELVKKGDRNATLDIREDDGWRKKGIGGTKESNKVGGSGGIEEFALDCHDLSLENVFVDESDPSKITCIIDWESTTTRPLWACAHLPSFLLSSPFAANLFRRAVASIAAFSGGSDELANITPSSSYSRTPFVSRKLAHFANPNPRLSKFANTAKAWLALERVGSPLRWAHRCAEWDGWEDGLVGSILGELGSDDLDEAYSTFISMDKSLANNQGWEEPLVMEMRTEFSRGLKLTGLGSLRSPNRSLCNNEMSPETSTIPATASLKNMAYLKAVCLETPKDVDNIAHRGAIVAGPSSLGVGLGPSLRRASDAERERERMLDVRGDVCGGRGGELGRRLEAWLVETSPERETGESSALADL